MTFDPDPAYDVDQAFIQDEIENLREQIKTKESHWTAYILGALGGFIGWRIAGTWDVVWGCGMLAGGIAEIAAGIDRVILHTRLQGECTRLAILRLRPSR